MLPASVRARFLLIIVRAFKPRRRFGPLEIKFGALPDARDEDRSLAALSDLHERSYVTFATAACKGRDEQRLAGAFVDHYAVRKLCGGTILMVVEHNTEHRAEIVHLLERLGVPDLPEVDLGVWDAMLQNT